MKYVYKMIQVPPGINIRAKDYRGGEAAGYLEEVVNQWAAQGWEFYRVDSIGVQVSAGCLGSFFGPAVQQHAYYVITFRAPAPPDVPKV
jgi:hypothetical protein